MLISCDQVSRDLLPEQIANVAKVFWPASPGSHDRVLACSSRMGLSAHMLREMSEHGKPKFIDFWDRKRVEYDVTPNLVPLAPPILTVIASVRKGDFGCRKSRTKLLSVHNG